MSSPPTRRRTVLDSDVIFSRVLHELLGRLGVDLELFSLIWSDELVNEAVRVLVERKRLDEPAARRWLGYLTQAFPTARVESTALPAEVNLALLTSDPADEHVCALAIAGHATLLVASDKSYNVAALAEYGVTVATPDSYLVQSYDADAEAVLEVLDAQARSWGGGRPLSQLLDALERAGAVQFVTRARGDLSLA